jgi:hypothetical protein
MGSWASLAKWDWSGSALGLWGTEVVVGAVVAAVGVVDMIACNPSWFLFFIFLSFRQKWLCFVCV